MLNFWGKNVRCKKFWGKKNIKKKLFDGFLHFYFFLRVSQGPEDLVEKGKEKKYQNINF